MKLKTLHSLIISLVSMLLTLVMLASTTFAWFSETVESARNVISTGNLDLAVNYSFNGEDWEPLTSDSVLFNENQTAKYEPGYTEFVYLELINDGELAFNYRTDIKVYDEKKGVNVKGETFALSDNIKVGVKEGECFDDVKLENREEAAKLSIGSFKANKILTTSAGPLAENGDKAYLALVIHMPATVGNEANYDDSDEDNKPSIDFAVNVLATQAAVEADDFTDTEDPDTYYDIGAEFPTYVATADEFEAAIAKGEDVKLNDSIALDEPFKVADDTDVIIDLNGETLSFNNVSDNEVAVRATDNAKLTIVNGTVSVPDAHTIGIFGSASIKALNCTFEGKYGFGMNGTTTSEDSYAYFENCKFLVNSAYNAAYISAKGTYVFKDCVLEGGAGALVRSGNVTFDGCDFIANGYYGKGNAQTDVFVNYDAEAYGDVVKNGVEYWAEKSKQEESSGDCLVIIDNSGDGYDLKSVTVKDCTFYVANTVTVDGVGVATGYAVRYLNKDASADAAVVTIINNTDTAGNAIVEGDIGLVCSYYTVGAVE